MWLRIVFIFLWLGVSGFMLFGTKTGQSARPQLIKEIPRITKRIANVTQELPKEIRVTPTPTPIPLTVDSFLTMINNARRAHKKPLLIQDKTLCPITKTLLSGENVTASSIKKTCQNCTNVITFVFDSYTSTQSAIQYIQNSSMSAVINESQMKNICIAADGSQIGVVAAKKIVPSTPPPIRNISEDELWQALMVYRQAHKMSYLEKNEKLCQYARKRVEDHVKMMAEHKPKDQYPVPAKYPLDAHDGFKKRCRFGICI